MTKKDDTEILFPEAKVGKYTIKPWSFGTLFKISGMLEIVLDKIEEKNILLEEGFISYITIARVLTLASDQVLSIIAVTLDVSEDEIKELDMETGIKLAMVIAKQNWEMIVKKSLSPFLTIPKEEEVGETTTK